MPQDLLAEAGVNQTVPHKRYALLRVANRHCHPHGTHKRQGCMGAGAGALYDCGQGRREDKNEVADESEDCGRTRAGG